MAHWLRVLVVLAEEPDTVSSTYMGVHNYPLFQFQEIQPSLLTYASTRHAYDTQTCRR